MKRVLLCALLFLLAKSSFAQERVGVRRHLASVDAATGAELAKETVIVRDQVYANGSVDVLVSRHGVDLVYSHRTLDIAVVTERYAIGDDALEVRQEFVLPSDDLRGTARVAFNGEVVAELTMPLDASRAEDLLKATDAHVPQPFQREMIRAIDRSPFEILRDMLSSRKESVPAFVPTTDQLIPPDCDFDERFGFPCSAGQKQSIADAVREGRVLESY